MSKFEAELRLPCKQPYAYINIVVRGETDEELYKALEKVEDSLTEKLLNVHTHAYDIVMSNRAKAAPKAAAPEPSPEDLIKSELGGKVVSEDLPGGFWNNAPDELLDRVTQQKPWERKKPAAKKAADPNDPFANFK